MQFYFQPLPLGKTRMGFRPVGQWITFSSGQYCAEVFYPLSHTLSFLLFSFRSDCVPFSFMLLSVVLEVSIRCDFRTPVQENNLNCTSKPSRFAGAWVQAVSAQLKFSWAGKGGQGSGAEHTGSCQKHTRQSCHAFPVFSLGCPIPNPTSVCLNTFLSGWETDSQGFAGERAEYMLGPTYFIFFSSTSASLYLPGCLFCLSYSLSVPISIYLLCDITQKCTSTKIPVDVVNSGSLQSLAAN